MRELRSLEELSLLLQILEYQRIRLLDKYARPIRLLCHLALAVDVLNKRHIILLANAVIILTECRSDMYYTSTILCRDIVITHDIKCLFRQITLCIIIERFILAVLKVAPLHARKDLPFSFYAIKYAVNKSLCKIIYLITNTDLHVIHIWVNAQAEIGWKCPWSRCPCEEKGILILHLELDHCRTLRHVLIALCDLM